MEGGSGESKTNLFVVLILILGKGRSGRTKDDFGCRSYFDFVEEEEWEILIEIYLSFSFCFC